MSNIEAIEGITAQQEVMDALQEAIEKLVELADPEAIIVFGSYAAGTAREDSDIDLVVIAETESRWRLASKLYLGWHDIYRRLDHLPYADILVYTPEEFVEGQVVGFPPYQAAREGVVVYGELPEISGAVAG